MRRLIAVALTCATVGSCAGVTEPVALGWSAARDYPTHREMDLGFQSIDGAVLSGTLILPKTPGLYGALVMHFGSDRWTRTSYTDVAGFLALGIAVFTYDKRGVGRSQGSCCPYGEPGYFPLLAQDVLAAAREVARLPEIRADRVGMFGFSQGGWVVPVAAAADTDLVRFTIIGSGPAVTLGEELLYSALSGEGQCQRSALTAAQLDSAVTAAGPSRFDPAPHLAGMVRPGLWIYGGLDFSIPVTLSVQRLAAVRDGFGRPFTIVVVPDINHTWVQNGGICQRTGPDWDDSAIIVPWLQANVLR